ncbi:patatin-like phospholipase family protein [Myxococcus sp. AM011]|uniref:patatin-like phospholipase family protein n=1 Tax=Myxococcus sp. AM011 TaxID=2745200 RepID=UPI001595A9FB|nr:patatin-like phospholipase family protein [Myxococcus sp. AM011]NVJ23084.1 patatin-like phospholipase family protein [Myxococcus sp. AM011]
MPVEPSNPSGRRALAILSAILIAVAAELYLTVLVGQRLSPLLVLALVCLVGGVLVFGYLLLTERGAWEMSSRKAPWKWRREDGLRPEERALEPPPPEAVTARAPDTELERASHLEVAEATEERRGGPVDTLGPRKRALILVGGGLRVAWQAGAIRALEDADLGFHFADATSAGSLNLAMLLSGVSPGEACARWRTLSVEDFLTHAAPRKSLDVLHVEPLGDPEKVLQRVFPHLGIDLAAIRASSLVEGTFHVCDFARKTDMAIPHRELDKEMLLAAISPPILMPPVEREGRLYTDALWTQDTHLLEAVRRGANELWVLWCVGNTPVRDDGLFEQYAYLVEMSANGALFAQLRVIEDINARIEAGEVVLGHRRSIAVHLIKPERPLALDPDLHAGRATAAALIDMGYSDTWRYLDVCGTRGLPLTPEMTRTTEPSPDLTFVESLTGRFTLGVTDPTEGALHPDAQTMTVHCTISVSDLDAFVSDVKCSARLVARLSFAPFGEDLPVRRGSFNIFRPPETPGTRVMTYGLRFPHQGRDYFLAGTKVVVDRKEEDAWKGSTRLLCQLHEGMNAQGPVVGAGVLTLGVGQLLSLISSMQPARREGAGTLAMDRFGRFFLGPLWEQYAPRAQWGTSREMVLESHSRAQA